MTDDCVVSGLLLPLWEEVLWHFLAAWDSVRQRTASTHCIGTSQGGTGRTASSSSSF